MRNYHFFVYIMASETRTLYIGMTNDLKRRVWQHKHKIHEGFTARYDCTRLVYFEEFRYVHNAIAREKELKGWRRYKKLNMITSHNPLFKDLAEDWYPGETE